MNKLRNKDNYFGFDGGTLRIIREIEEYLGLRNKDIDKMEYDELIAYVDKIILTLKKKRVYKYFS